MENFRHREFLSRSTVAGSFMETLFVSLAYRYVALALMLAEANHAIDQLDLPDWKPIAAAEIVSHHVSPPRLRPGGSLDTRKFMFGFGSEGKLQFIHAYQPEHDLPVEERNKRWSTMKSLIGTNEAHQLATNWLAKLDVDVAALERTHPVRVNQEFFYEGGIVSPERVVMLPRFEVKWGTNSLVPAVWVSVFGPTKEPLQIRQHDVSFSKRPAGLVKEPERLLAIRDSDFAKYTESQKSNLVFESAVAKYRHYSLPEIVKAVPTNGIGKRTLRAPVDTRKPTRFPHPKVKTVPPAPPHTD